MFESQAQVCGYCGAPVREAAATACAYCGTAIVATSVAPVTIPTVDVVLHDRGRNAIAVIKQVREHTGLGLKEAKDLVDATEQGPVVVARALDPESAALLVGALERAGAGVKTADGAPVVGAAPAGPADAGEGLGRFDVVLRDAGRQPILVIKAVRERTGLGLKESKDVVDASDRHESVVASGLEAVDARAFVDELRAAGGDAIVRALR